MAKAWTIWTWGEWPEAAPPPPGVNAVPMARARFGALPSDPVASIGDARHRGGAYVERLLAEARRLAGPGGDIRRIPLCLSRVADTTGEGILVDGWFPYWALVFDQIQTDLMRFYGDEPPAGVVLHSEDGRRERQRRDERLSFLAISRLRHRWGERAILTGYGLQYAAHASPGPATYRPSPFLLADHLDEYQGDGLRTPIPWIPAAGHLRRDTTIPQVPHREELRLVTAADVSAYLGAYRWAGIRHAILWSPHADRPEHVRETAWRETWRGVEAIV